MGGEAAVQEGALLLLVDVRLASILGRSTLAFAPRDEWVVALRWDHSFVKWCLLCTSDLGVEAYMSSVLRPLCLGHPRQEIRFYSPCR